MCCRLPERPVRKVGRLWRLAFIPFFLAGSPAMAVTAGAPAISQPDSGAVLLHVGQQPERRAERLPLAARVRSLISRARESGSPRPLGRAAALLEESPPAQQGAEFHTLRATVRQSLHRFDDAVADLERAIALEPDNVQAWFTRYVIARTRGRLRPLDVACEALTRLEQGLIAASCRSEALVLREKPEQAWQMLTQAITEAGDTDPLSLHWARVTRADLAERQGRDGTGALWRRALVSDPQDRYVRARLAGWHLRQGEPDAVVRLTDGHTGDDQMAVLRLIALERLQDPAAVALRDALASRLRDARRRGELLHKRAWARYLLDVAGEPRRALRLARENWREQRELPDRRLLEQARNRTALMRGTADAGEVR